MEEIPVKLENYIGGKFIPSSLSIKSYNPSTGEVLALVPDSSTDDINEAVTAAQSAFPRWSSLPISERAKILLKIADVIESRIDEFAEAESMDQGKPLWLSREVEMQRVLSNFRHFATTALCDTDKAVHQSNLDVINYTVHSAVGVAALIVPWNLPLYLLTFKLAPALVYGNCVVIKPSEFTSVTTWMLCTILKECGVPDGVVNVVFGYGFTIGETLVAHKAVQLISFTGSTKTGCHIAEVAAKTNKKVSLEMGGKNAAVVFNDANLLKCVPELIRASFINQGQVCLSTSRIFVQEKIFQGFCEIFSKETKNLKIGCPMDKDTFLGPLCSLEHLKKVKQYIETAKKNGLTFLVSPKEDIHLTDINKNGYFVSPVVLTNVPDDSCYMQEEIFGPVTCIVPFKTEEEVIQRVNATTYGLCASIWSQNIERIHKTALQLQVGTVWCNCWLHRNLHMPFGGTKMSSQGREGTEESREFYTTKTTVCINYH